MQGQHSPVEAAHADASAQNPVAVVGLGKIGLPLSVQYISHGKTVIGCDISTAVVDGLNRGECHVHEEPGMEAEVAKAVAEGKLRATTDTTEGVRQAKVVVVIVPVVVREHGVVAYEGIDAATRAVGKGLQKGTLVVYETTLPAGTTSKRFRAILEEASGLRAGEDFYLAYSPERVSSGSIFRDLKTYPKVVGGINPASTHAAKTFYGSVLDAQIIEMASADDAEFVKLIETTYRDVNIALANEYARYADARGLDVLAAIAAANTQPYSHIHQPGPGVGGHCIPVYPYFLMADTQPDGEELSIPRRSRVVNDDMAKYSVERIEEVTGPLAGKAVLLMGIAYRGDVKETAFTTAKLVQEALRAHGATVYAQDPLFTDEEITHWGYTPYSAEHAGEIAAIVVQAAHSAYQEFGFTQFPQCRALLDGRRGLDRASIDRAKIEAAGMAYIVIGNGQHAHVPATVR